MKKMHLAILLLLPVGAMAQDWHLNTEPVYFFAKAPNIALDYAVSRSLSVGFQYSALDWGKNGSNLSGVQVFYTRTAQIDQNSEILKLYAGLLSANTSLLNIEAKADPLPLFEVLYGYRWVFRGNFTVAVLAGTFFTSKHIYPGISFPVGYVF